MPRRHHDYTSDDIDVHYDVVRCIHAAECVRGLPHVFNPNERPWINPEEESAEAIASVILRCPTGALHFTRTDGGPEETPLPENRVSVQPDGPLYVRGDLRIETSDGEVLLEDTRMALCRCGLSEHKPFCDNSHLDRFEDEGTLGTAKVNEAGDETVLHIVLGADGPLRITGPLTIRGADGESVTTGKCALCRCGQSSNKPFCDGTHRDIGFEAPGDQLP